MSRETVLDNLPFNNADQLRWDTDVQFQLMVPHGPSCTTCNEFRENKQYPYGTSKDQIDQDYGFFTDQYYKPPTTGYTVAWSPTYVDPNTVVVALAAVGVTEAETVVAAWTDHERQEAMEWSRDTNLTKPGHIS